MKIESALQEVSNYKTSHTVLLYTVWVFSLAVHYWYAIIMAKLATYRLSHHSGYFYSKRSLIDNMLTMMEKYANNLEDIVAERTRQLELEKIKSEELLYKMLPK